MKLSVGAKMKATLSMLDLRIVLFHEALSSSFKSLPTTLHME